MNRINIVLICIFASFLMSGLLNQIGLISEPVALAFDISLTDAVASFGYFTVGVFAGSVLSFFVFDYFHLKSVTVLGYLALTVTIAGLCALNSDKTLPLFLFAIGVFAGIQVCGASTLVSTIWQEKPRQTMLIAQDAMFNGGGIIFTILTTWFLTSGFHWASTYAVVGVLALAIAIIAAKTEFKQASVSEEMPTPQTQWASGILLVGVSLLLFMTAKISIFIWAPQYIVERFDADIATAGGLLTNIFVGAFCGSLAGTWLVSRIQIDYFLMIMLTIGATGLWMLVSVEDLPMALITAYIVGASVGATFNGYTAFGLSFVTKPTHKHVAYILIAGGVGSGVAPWFSSAAVERLGSVSDALVIFLGIQVTVLLSILLLSLYKHRYHQKDKFNSMTHS